jgi:hypothetical protein
MSYPSSITLNIGSPAADVVFDDKHAGPGALDAILMAESPNDDLTGRPRMRISHETTAKGIARSLLQLIFPVADSDGKYDQITVNLTVLRPTKVSLAEVDRATEAMAELLDTSGVRPALSRQLI